MSDLLQYKRPGGWELLPVGQVVRRIVGISLVAAVVAVVPIVALYRLRQPLDILEILFFTSVCAVSMGGLIGATLVRFGRQMYLRPFPFNWILLCGSILACTTAGSLIANLIFQALNTFPFPDFWSSFWSISLFSAIFALTFGLGSFVFEVLRTTLAVRQLEEERARKRVLEAQLASLESHIRPHFLFNALNTISSLIPDDPKLAEALVGKLAALLRFSLDAPQGGLTPLGRELKIVRDYLEIENARFGDRLRYRFEVPSAMEADEVPAFCLQTLVENSVKYAVGAREEGGMIVVRASNGDGSMCLEVADDGPGFAADAMRAGHGLDNLKGRLAAIYGTAGRLEIESAAGRAVVRILFPK